MKNGLGSFKATLKCFTILAKVDIYLSEIHRWPLFERQTAKMSNPSTWRDGIQVRELIHA